MSTTTEVQPDVIPVLAQILTRMVVQNDKIHIPPSKISIFHSNTPPSISVQEYLERIIRFSVCSNYCFVVALIYIDRIAEKEMLITSRNVHRLLITSLVLASKMYDDDFYQNKYYAQVGGLDVQELNELEVKMLFMLNFSLTVDAETFEKYNYQLSKHVKKIPSAVECPTAASDKIDTAIALNQYLTSQTTTAAAQPSYQYNNHNLQNVQASMQQPHQQQAQDHPSYPQQLQQQSTQKPKFNIPVHHPSQAFPHTHHTQQYVQDMQHFRHRQYPHSYPQYIAQQQYYQWSDDVLSPRTACEVVLRDEIKSRSLAPHLVQRAAELLAAEIAYKALTPSIVRTICDRLAEENDPVPISPSTVMRACARVESLRLGNMNAISVYASRHGY